MQPEIVNYIKEALGFGLSEMEIKKNLLDAGWEAASVEEALVNAKTHLKQPAPNTDEDIKLPQNDGQAINTPEKQASQFRPMFEEKPKTQFQQTQVFHQQIYSSAQKNENIAPVKQETSEQALPAADFSDSNYQNTSKKTGILKLIVIVLGSLIILGGGGYAAYAYFLGSPSPDKVWNKFLAVSAEKIYKEQFLLSYSDSGEVSGEEGFGLSLKDMKLTLSGNSYIDETDANNPQMSASVQYKFASGNTDFSTGLEFMLINNIFYFNAGNNLFLNNIFKSINNGEAVEWVKLDLGALKKKADQELASNGPDFNKILNDNLKNELTKIWKNKKFVNVKYLNKEKIGEISVYHFSNELDKNAVKTSFTETADKIFESWNKEAQSSEQVKTEDLEIFKTLTNKIIDKFEVKEFETWIGVKDARLYKAKLVTNAPSVVSLLKNASKSELLNSNVQSNDEKRLSDIRQMASSLELYFYDNEGYPDGLNGVPQNMTPIFIETIPAAPTPPDGRCTDYYNSYWYEPKGEKVIANGKTLYSSYELIFCLGYATGGYEAGIAKLSPAGIENNIACPTPDKPELCVSASPNNSNPNQTPSVQEQIEKFIDDMDFSSKFEFNSSFSDYGIKKQLLAPAGAFDLNEKMDQKVFGAFTSKIKE